MNIRLTRGEVARIDPSDAEIVARHSWRLGVDGGTKRKKYAMTTVGEKSILMHRLIMDPRQGFEIDHINGDGLDNRRSNLRVCTRKQNQQNMRTRRSNRVSRFKGVAYYRHGKSRWGARIGIDGKDIHLGMFSTEEGAARAYDKAARQHFGEFAQPNFPA